MAESIVDRLGAFLYHQKLNHSDLARLLGYSSSEKISRLFRKSGSLPGAELIIDIANKFVTELNIEWWITGRGEMIKTYNADLSMLNEPAPGYKLKKNQPLNKLLNEIDEVKKKLQAIEKEVQAVTLKKKQ